MLLKNLKKALFANEELFERKELVHDPLKPFEPHWIRTDEYLPMDGEHCLVYTPSGIYTATFIRDEIEYHRFQLNVCGTDKNILIVWGTCMYYKWMPLRWVEQFVFVSPDKMVSGMLRLDEQ